MRGQAPWETGPDAGRIEAMARAAHDRLPEEFRRHLGDIVFEVEEEADRDTLDALGIDDPLMLSGLYQGVPMDEKSSMDVAPMPDRIFLYRRAILLEAHETGVDLEKLVEHVLVHEVGHHFGLSDDDMHRLEDEA